MSEQNFTANREFLSSQHTISATAEEVFPLLCPVREFDWIEEWDCELIYSDSGLAELGCIFSTYNSEDGGNDIWVISSYHSNESIRFIRVNSIRSIRYDLTLTQDGDKTHILWEQVITALNEQGNEFLKTVNQSNFDKQIKMLETFLNYYLEHGKCMPIS